MSIKCDVLVVGGGPAGCSTARAAAKKGLKTILIEEDKEIGSPVQCAEGIGSYLFRYMPFKIPRNQLKKKIKGMYFWANSIAIKKRGRVWSGYSINRKNWDQWLASMAVNRGVEVLTNTKLKTLEFEQDFQITKAIAISNGKKITFKPKYIVAADGVDSTVTNCLDVKKEDTVLGYVTSYEMKNLKIKYPEYDQLFFGEFAPKTYAYIFPLSTTTANIGVGTINKKDNLNSLYDRFTEIPLIKKQISEGKIVIEKGGSAPISKLSNRLTYGNAFFVGDAANQNIKPFLEGNIPGIICGNILGNFIYKVDKGKVDPNRYESIVDKEFSLIKKSEKYANIILKEREMEDKMFNLFLLGVSSGIIPPKEKVIQHYIGEGYNYLEGEIIKNGGFYEE